jgi:hypothetical protein
MAPVALFALLALRSPCLPDEVFTTVVYFSAVIGLRSMWCLDFLGIAHSELRSRRHHSGDIIAELKKPPDNLGGWNEMAVSKTWLNTSAVSWLGRRFFPLRGKPAMNSRFSCPTQTTPTKSRP